MKEYPKIQSVFKRIFNGGQMKIPDHSPECVMAGNGADNCLACAVREVLDHVEMNFSRDKGFVFMTEGCWEAILKQMEG